MNSIVSKKTDKTGFKRLAVATLASFAMNLLATNEAFAHFFTKIADSNDPSFINFGFYPAINDRDTVIFSANLNEDGKATSIYTSNGTTILTIANTDERFSFFGNAPAINDAGKVAFLANLKTIGSGIYLIENGITNTIAESSQPIGVYENPVLNNEDAIAFSAATQEGRGLYISNGGVTTAITDTSSYSMLDGYAIADSGTIAFSASLGESERGIFTAYNGKTTTIADTNNTFSFLFPPAINNASTIIFKGVLKVGGEGIYTIKDGNITTIVDNSGSFSFFESYAVNDSDRVAFKATLDNGEVGIYTGSDPVADKAIAVGDILFGLKVTNLFLSNKALNNKSKFVFYAKFENGSSGIYLVDLAGEDNQRL